MKALNITKPTVLIYEAGAAIYTDRYGTGIMACRPEVAEATACAFGMAEIVGAVSPYDDKPVRM